MCAELDPLLVKASFHGSDPPNPWEGYQLALESGLENAGSHTHLLLLQEDVILCRNFVPAVERIAAAKPADPVCLFLAWLPRHVSAEALQASVRGERYLRFRVSQFVPVVAILWPLHKASEFLNWSRSGVRLPGYPNRVASDDAVVAEWHRRCQETIWVSCPSLVEHDDEQPSVKGKRYEVWGRDRSRVAANFIGDADPLALDWT